MINTELTNVLLLVIGFILSFNPIDSTRLKGYNKLSPKYFGPFQILQKVGHVTYNLPLPDGCLIHPNVSCFLFVT